MKGQKQTPRNARTFNQIARLETDHADTREHWAMLNEKNIYIVKQRNGETATEKIRLPRRTFEKFCDWYNGHKPRKSRKVAKR